MSCALLEYDGKLKKNHFLTRVCSYKNLKPNSSIRLPPDLELIVEKLKCVHLQCHVWLIVLTSNFTFIEITVS